MKIFVVTLPVIINQREIWNPMGQNEVYNCTVPYEFATFMRSGPPYISSCLRGETRSIIVMFHMGLFLAIITWV